MAVCKQWFATLLGENWEQCVKAGSFKCCWCPRRVSGYQLKLMSGWQNVLGISPLQSRGLEVIGFFLPRKQWKVSNTTFSWGEMYPFRSRRPNSHGTHVVVLCHVLWTVVPPWTKALPKLQMNCCCSSARKVAFWSHCLLFEVIIIFESIYYLTVTAETQQCFISPLWVHVLGLPMMPPTLMLPVFTTGCLGIVNNFEAAGVTYFLEAFAFWLFLRVLWIPGSLPWKGNLLSGLMLYKCKEKYDFEYYATRILLVCTVIVVFPERCSAFSIEASVA